MGKSKRVQVTPTPQSEAKLAVFMEKEGIKSKAQAIRTILHRVSVGQNDKV